MRCSNSKLIVLLFLISGCSGSKPKETKTPGPEPKPVGIEATRPQPERPIAAQAPRPVQVAADTKLKLGKDATIIVPARWMVTTYPDRLTLEEPDKGAWMAVVRVQSTSAGKAIDAAWQKARPGSSFKVKRTINMPARDGWDVITQISYETPTRERRAVLAVAHGKGTTFYITLIDGKHSAMSRRGAQIMQVIGSLKVAGVEKESFAGKQANTLDATRLAAFEAFVKDALAKLKVVGAAVALIQGNKVVYKKGFGVRRKGTKRPVTTKTLFMIGSINKSLTSMMMAKLVDEGKFTWETPAVKVYPAFSLADAELTGKCLMRHTVCACTGLPRQDLEFLFEFKGATAEKRMKLLGTMKPTTGFGETFQYSNLMVAAGGYMAAHAAFPKLKLHPAYLKAMKTRLFDPVGMKQTTFDFRTVQRTDHAVPHSPNLSEDYEPIPLSYEQGVASVGPAGAAWSNVEDMARFILLELNKGKNSEGKQVVTEKNLTERWKPQVKIRNENYYGLALTISTGRGVRVIGHGGGTLGFSTYMLFLPEHGVGMIALTNNAGAGVNSIITRKLMEILFDGKDVASKSLAFSVELRKKSFAKALKDNKLNLNPDKEWIKKLAGTYHNESLGRIIVRLIRGKGVLDAGEWKAPIGSMVEKDGVVKLVIGPPLAGFAFIPGTKEGLKTLTLSLGQHTYLFVEKGKRAKAVPARKAATARKQKTKKKARKGP